MPELASVAAHSELEVGSLKIRPHERRIVAGSTTLTVEPLIMQLLVVLSRQAGRVVSRRDIFEICWGEAPVGDDSLNRIVAVLRKALRSTAGDQVRIETVPGEGYILRLSPGPESGSHPANASGEAQRAIAAARDSWRLGLPEPDHLRLEQLRLACLIEPANTQTWGMLALLCRHAAEYAQHETLLDHVRECESAARQAVAIDPDQPEALTALASVVPLFGRWSDGRKRLIEVLRRRPGSAVAQDELAVLEMATGRIRESKRLRDHLITADPLAAIHCYKAIYQHWSIGDMAGLDHVGDRAIQLWPRHPAVWMARLWSLAYTDRIPAALAMLEDSAARPAIPVPALRFLKLVLSAASHGSRAQRDEAAAASRKAAQTGPANALASLFALSLLDRFEDVFAVAEGYYLRGGELPVPIRHTEAEPSLNEQHRRLTQILFTPVFGQWRSEARFLSLCERIGLAAYWEENGLTPDFLA